MPFIQTALVHDEDENILHVGGWRIRVVGTGNLDGIMYSLDSIQSLAQPTVTMASTNRKEPFQLTNFISQRAMLRLSTDQIDEIFDISRIIFYVKPLWSGYPQ